MTDSQVIEIAKIDWPKVSKNDRTHNNEYMEKLALSIQVEGMHQPIMVRTTEESRAAGRFIGVFGRHRAGAHKILKRDAIEAKVADDMTEEEATIATDSENLFHNPLSDVQNARAMGRWLNYYDQKRAEYNAAVAAAKPARGRQPKKKVAADPGPSATDSPTPSPQPEPAPLPPKPPENIAAHVASVTGQSQSTVQRAMQIGKSFTDEQLEVFEQCKTTQEWMTTIAKIQPESLRAGIVNLIAAGLEPVDAVAQATGQTEVKTASGRTHEASATSEGAAKTEDEMTDEEWVIFHCAETLALLADKALFVAHAILYRKVRSERQALKSRTKKSLEKAKQDGLFGGFYAILNRLCGVAHPKHWLRCGTCSGGSAQFPGGGKCSECRGNCFVVKMEGN